MLLTNYLKSKQDIHFLKEVNFKTKLRQQLTCLDAAATSQPVLAARRPLLLACSWNPNNFKQGRNLVKLCPRTCSLKAKDTRIKSKFWDVAPMICCKMVWTGDDSCSAHALCCLMSQRWTTGGSMMAYIQREDWQQRRGEQEQRWRRLLF